MENYQKPQMTVEQSLSVAPIAADRDQPAFVFGPHYQLHRTGIEDASETYLGGYNHEDGSVEYAYPGVKTDVEAVDKGYNRLFGENVVVELAALETPSLPEQQTSSSGSGVPSTVVNENGGYTVLFFHGKKYVGSKADGLDESLERGIAVGDSIAINYSIGNVKSDIVATVVKAEYRDAEDSGNIDDDSYEELDLPGTMLVISDPIAIGYTQINSVKFCKLEGIAEFDRKNVNHSVNQGNIWEWKDDGDKIVVNNLYTVVYGYGDTPVECKVLFADLHLTFREMLTSFSDTIHSVSSSTGVAELLGTVDPDNPLAMGVYMAALNSTTDNGLESPSVFFMAVPTNDIDGYAKVLNSATLTDKIYFMAPTTSDVAVINLLKSHINDMSSRTNKHWRFGVVCKRADASVQVVGPDSVSGGDRYAIPVSPTQGTAVGATDYNMVRITKSAIDPTGDADAQLGKIVTVGDVVRFGYYTDEWDEYTYKTYTVTRVINSNTVMVDAECIDTSKLTPDTNNYKPAKVEIWHKRTNGQMALAVKSISASLASRRMANVFPAEFEMGGVSLTGEFAACAVAGLASGCEPQQPLTNLAITGIDDVRAVYQTFNQDELDTIASGGTFIIAQDLPGDKVYVRHQITTAYPDGNLNTAEMSITKNLDSISYAFADLFAPYIGKYNITEELIDGLEALASSLINQLGANNGSEYGPQLIIDGTDILWVKRNQLKKDKVDICVRLNLPYPCNFIDIVLTV